MRICPWQRKQALFFLFFEFITIRFHFIFEHMNNRVARSWGGAGEDSGVIYFFLSNFLGDSREIREGGGTRTFSIKFFFKWVRARKTLEAFYSRDLGIWKCDWWLMLVVLSSYCPSLSLVVSFPLLSINVNKKKTFQIFEKCTQATSAKSM